MSGVLLMLASSSGGRNNFVNQAVNLVNQYNLDGVDIDWDDWIKILKVKLEDKKNE